MPYKQFYVQLEQRIKEFQREAADRNQVKKEVYRSYQAQTVLHKMFLFYYSFFERVITWPGKRY
jgi:hypothetical protein